MTDLLGDGFKANTTIVEGGHQLDEMGEGTAEPIESPDHQSVASSQLLEDAGKRGSIGTGTGDGIGKDPLAASPVELIVLELWVLFVFGDTGIANEYSGGIVSKLVLIVK